MEDVIKKLPTTSKKVVGYSLLGAGVLIVLINSIFTVSAGQIAIEQTPSGKLIPHMEPGIKFKTPFVSVISTYNEVTTVTYSAKDGSSTSNNAPFDITFADTYGGLVKGSFRIEMPKDPDKFVTLHKAFKSYDNFVDNGIEKFTDELLAYTANQFTGEAFMQGGQNEYKSRLKQQAIGGLFVTKRTAVKVSRESGNVGLDNDESGKTTTVEQVVYRNIIQRDANGKAQREENPMSKYGVAVTQVTIDGFIPEIDLEKFMGNKKDMVQKRARLIENQENERQSAITAKLKGDRERIQAKQLMLREKDAAVIKADKEVALAVKAAERETVDRQKLAALAIIDKTKQLQVAKANEGIQRANAVAAKHQANAITYKGMAEAKVKTAMYSAVRKDILILEVEKATQLAKYKALATARITMPSTVMMGGGSEGNLNELTNLHIMDKLK